MSRPKPIAVLQELRVAMAAKARKVINFFMAERVIAI
jgi:hypothetical protein